MKTEPNDPIHILINEGETTYNGITKREYYAGLALQGLLAASEDVSVVQSAREAVQAADALIFALNASHEHFPENTSCAGLVEGR